MSLEQPLCLESDQAKAFQVRMMDSKGHGNTVKYCALSLLHWTQTDVQSHFGPVDVLEREN